MPDTFFNPHQRATVEAAMARIIPTDDTPGAREAGCIDFVDRYLSGIGFIFAKPDGSGFETLEGRPAEAWMQRIEIMRGRYVEGIADLDDRARAQVFGATSSISRRSSRTRSCGRSKRRAPAQPTTLAVERRAGRPGLAANPLCSRPRPRSISTSCRC